MGTANELSGNYRSFVGDTSCWPHSYRVQGVILSHVGDNRATWG